MGNLRPIEEDLISPRELIALEEELLALRQEYGITRKESWWVRLGDKIMAGYERSEARKEPVSRRKYIRLALTCGWFCGAHRFYNRQILTGFLYLLLCWTGIPIAMTFVDLMIVLPLKADEDGMIIA